MPRYRIDLSWDGTDYCGWQRQPDCVSIQGMVETAIQQIFPNENIGVQAAGRTDAGVHALHQIAAFSVEKKRDSKDIQRGINAHLPRDITCLNVKKV
jgi:tRNA pseudouridine38-40 synthase